MVDVSKASLDGFRLGTRMEVLDAVDGQDLEVFECKCAFAMSSE